MQAVVFDMDGVLIDCQTENYEAWRRALSNYGTEITREEFDSVYGLTGDDIVREFLGSDTPTDTIRDVRESKNSVFLQLTSDIAPLDGVEELVRDLGSDAALGVATSASDERAKHILQATGLRSQFDVVNTSKDIEAGKPDPEIYVKTLQELGVSGSESVVIEDSPKGITAANAAGAFTVGVTTTHGREQFEEADIVLEHPKHIAEEEVFEL